MRIMLISRCADEKYRAISKGADEKYRAISRGADEKQRLSRGVLMRTRDKRCADENQG